MFGVSLCRQQPTATEERSKDVVYTVVDIELGIGNRTGVSERNICGELEG
jgi:hypothetical protein